MTGLRSLLASLGVALAGLGLAFVLVPGAAGALSLPRLGVVVLGVFALVEAARSLQARRRSRIDGADPPAPESRLETVRPGDGFDARLAALGRRPGRRWAGGEHERLRRRLHAAAVEAVAHRWRLPIDAARERVGAGEWTDDPAAAWFLGERAVPTPPWSVRFRAAVVARTRFEFYATRAADAVVALREEG